MRAEANCSTVGGWNTELLERHHFLAPMSAGRSPLRPLGVSFATAFEMKPIGLSIITTAPAGTSISC